MSDEKKLELAREIYPDSKRAGRSSFSTVQWSGVERAWEWIGKNYHPQEPPMKQDHGCRGCNDPAYFHTPECIAKRPPPWTVSDPHATEVYQDDKIIRWRSGNGATYFLRKDDFKMSNTPTYKGVPMKQESATPNFDSDPNAPAFSPNPWQSPPWTAEQREAGFQVNAVLTDEDSDDIAHVCAAIAKAAPLFVSPPPVPSVVKVNRHYGDVGIDIEVIGSDGKAMHTEMVPWVEVDRCRLIGSVPSVEECERAYKEAWEDEMPHLHSSMVTRGESAGIAAVRALFVQGDGASVRGFDSHRAHPEGQPAPSPAPAPDREALANLMQLALAKHPNDAVAPLHDCRQDIIALRYRQADAAIAHFAPIVAALTRERDEARAECEKAMFSARLFCGAHVGVPQKSCPVCARDAALARVAEMEKERDEAYRVAGTAIGTDPVFFNAGCVAALADHAERLRSTNCEQRLHMARLVTERDALRKELAERCDQVDSLQHDRDKIMARLGNACQTYEIEDRIRALQGRVAALTRERDEARGKARSVTREELRKMEDAAVNNFGSWSDDLEAALRAVGIEVVG